MKLDLLVKLHNDLFQLKDGPSAVLYDPVNGLVFRQLGKVVAIPYFNNYYFPKPKLKVGVLTQAGCVNLLQTLERLIEDPSTSDDEFGLVMKGYSLQFFKCYRATNLIGPQLVAELKFVTIRGVVLSDIYLSNSDPESKTLIKAILNEKRNRKRNKSIQVTTAS